MTNEPEIAACHSGGCTGNIKSFANGCKKFSRHSNLKERCRLFTTTPTTSIPAAELEEYKELVKAQKDIVISNVYAASYLLPDPGGEVLRNLLVKTQALHDRIAELEAAMTKASGELWRYNLNPAGAEGARSIMEDLDKARKE